MATDTDPRQDVGGDFLPSGDARDFARKSIRDNEEEWPSWKTQLQPNQSSNAETHAPMSQGGGADALGGVVKGSLLSPLRNQFWALSKSVRDFQAAASRIDYDEKKKIEAKKCRATPEAILSSPECRAQVLTISDLHATILLTHSIFDSFGGDEGDVSGVTLGVESLLKLTVVPFHKPVLGKKPSSLEEVEGIRSGEPMTDEDVMASNDILSFLSKYKFDMMSESGAEYSFYNASPYNSAKYHSRPSEEGLVETLNKALLGVSVGIGGNAVKASADQATPKENISDSSFGKFKVELISPATDKQIKRAMPSPVTEIVEETSELYEAVTRPYIEEIVSGNSLDWITNVVEGRKETERLLLDHEDYILHIDTKWRSHPDPNTIPREEWYNHDATEDLYCLAILKKNGVASLRDLRSEHLPALRSMLTDAIKTIEQVYGVSSKQIRAFVHYQPQFYHFHVHFTHLRNENGCQIERGHLLRVIVQNLEMDSDFYTKRIMTYRLTTFDELYKRINAHEAEGQRRA